MNLQRQLIDQSLLLLSMQSAFKINVGSVLISYFSTVSFWHGASLCGPKCTADVL